MSDNPQRREPTAAEPALREAAAYPDASAADNAAEMAAPEALNPTSDMGQGPPAPGAAEAKQASDAAEAIEPRADSRVEATPDDPPAVENSVADNMEELAAAVLDSAEIANQSAHVAGRATHNLLDASERLREASVKGHKLSMYVAGGAGGLLLIALIVFIAMANAMNNRLQRVDTMLMAVATRVVEMNTGLASLDHIQASIADFYNVQASFRDAQVALERRIEAVASASEELAAVVPGRTAEEVGLRNEELALRLGVLERAVSDQKAAYDALERNMGAFSASVGTLERRLGNVDRLNRDVSALVTLQRERYLEAVQAEQAARQRPREDTFVTYQRPSPPAEEGAPVQDRSVQISR